MSRSRYRRGTSIEFEDRVPNKCGSFMEQRCRNQRVDGGPNQKSCYRLPRDQAIACPVRILVVDSVKVRTEREAGGLEPKTFSVPKPARKWRTVAQWSEEKDAGPASECRVSPRLVHTVTLSSSTVHQKC